MNARVVVHAPSLTCQMLPSAYDRPCWGAQQQRPWGWPCNSGWAWLEHHHQQRWLQEPAPRQTQSSGTCGMPRQGPLPRAWPQAAASCRGLTGRFPCSCPCCSQALRRALQPRGGCGRSYCNRRRQCTPRGPQGRGPTAGGGQCSHAAQMCVRNRPGMARRVPGCCGPSRTQVRPTLKPRPTPEEYTRAAAQALTLGWAMDRSQGRRRQHLAGGTAAVALLRGCSSRAGPPPGPLPAPPPPPPTG